MPCNHSLCNFMLSMLVQIPISFIMRRSTKFKKIVLFIDFKITNLMSIFCKYFEKNDRFTLCFLCLFTTVYFL